MKNQFLFIVSLLFINVNLILAQSATLTNTTSFGTGYDAEIDLSTPTELNDWELKLTISGNINSGGYVLFNGTTFPSTNFSQNGDELIMLV